MLLMCRLRFSPLWDLEDVDEDMQLLLFEHE